MLLLPEVRKKSSYEKNSAGTDPSKHQEPSVNTEPKEELTLTLTLKLRASEHISIIVLTVGAQCLLLSSGPELQNLSH